MAGLHGARARPVQRYRRRQPAGPVDGVMDDDLPRLRLCRQPAGLSRLLDGLADRDRRHLFLHRLRLVRRDRHGSTLRFHASAPAGDCRHPPLPAARAPGAAARSLAPVAMRRRGAPLVTENSQSFTFSRRAFVLNAGQWGIAALLAGRMAYISLAENEHYKTMAEENRVHMRLIPPRRGLILDRHNIPMAINAAAVRVDLMKDLIEDEDRVVAAMAELLQLPADEVQRIRDALAHAQGSEPVPVAENITREQYYAISVRLPELPGVAPLE